MEPDSLVEAVRLAAKGGFVFLATADTGGWPHLAIAGKVGLTPERHLVLEEWFCPRTMTNLRANPRVAVVMWDLASDTGYQLLGEMEETRDLGIVAGHNGDAEGGLPVPRVERQLIVHIDRALVFRRGPHRDTEVVLPPGGGLDGDTKKDGQGNRSTGNHG